MKKLQHILIVMAFCLTAKNNLQAQAGTYDNTFSGDGKEIYSRPFSGGSDIKRPFIFVYNNKIIVFTNDYDSNGELKICLLKYDMQGVFISKVDILYPMSNLTNFQLWKVKQTNNGKFVLSYVVNDYTVSNEYNAYIAVVDSNGSLDLTFDGDGKKWIAIPVSIPDTQGAEIDLYPDNSIFVVFGKNNSSGFTKMTCYKISPIGLITNSFTVGGGTFDYFCQQVKVNSDGTIFISGLTTDTQNNPSQVGITYDHFIFKLTSNFNYNTLFNTSGKLYLSKGNAINTQFLVSTTGSLFVYHISQQDGYISYGSSGQFPNRRQEAGVKKYTSTGLLTAENTMYTYTSTPVGIYGDFATSDNIELKEDINGGIIICQTEKDTSNLVGAIKLIRLDATSLTYDNTFGTNGQKLISFSATSNEQSGSCFIQSDGKILIVFEHFDYLTSISPVAIARINNNIITTDISNLSKDNFSLYPSPAKNELYLKLNDTEHYPVDIEFYSTNGQLVKKEMIENETIQTSLLDMADGLYIVKLNTAKGVNYTSKLLIQK